VRSPERRGFENSATHSSKILLKLGAANRIEAARIARGKGWL
jgi:DNA-binding NarL/FixJ family response regulator